MSAKDVLLGALIGAGLSISGTFLVSYNSAGEPEVTEVGSHCNDLGRYTNITYGGGTQVNDSITRAWQANWEKDTLPVRKFRISKIAIDSIFGRDSTFNSLVFVTAKQENNELTTIVWGTQKTDAEVKFDSHTDGILYIMSDVVCPNSCNFVD